jgi:CheY-like chemotaxis protein
MRTALVLDDQGAYLRALARSLRGQLDVVVAETQAAAKSSIRPEISLALVDICLSQSDAANREGLEFIRWLRAVRPDVRIVAMSARDEAELPQQTLEAGADVFLPKPLRISELKTVLAKLGK